MHGVLFGGHSRIQLIVQQTITSWISLIKGFRNGDRLSAQLEETELALLWGVICCYPYAFDSPHNVALLMDLINEIDQLIMIQDGMIVSVSAYISIFCSQMHHDGWRATYLQAIVHEYTSLSFDKLVIIILIYVQIKS